MTYTSASHAFILKGQQSRWSPRELESDGHRRRSLNLCPEGEGRRPCLSSTPECVSVSLRSLRESTSGASHTDEYFRCGVTLFWQQCVFFSVAAAAQTRLRRRCRTDASRKFCMNSFVNADGLVLTGLAQYAHVHESANIRTASSYVHFELLFNSCFGVDFSLMQSVVPIWVPQCVKPEPQLRILPPFLLKSIDIVAKSRQKASNKRP